jgi:prolipoprotein diacylglyceryltransferase
VAVQLLGAGWSAIVLVILLVWERRPRRQGVAFSLWLTLHSLGSFGLGFLRADQLFAVAGWRVDQLANLALGAAGVVLLASRLVNGRRGVTA